MAAVNGNSEAAATATATVRELWRHPDPSSTPMHGFIQHVNAKYSLTISNYPTLYQWSVDHVPEFWEEVWHFVGIRSSQPFKEVSTEEYGEVVTLPRLSISISSHLIPWTHTEHRAKDLPLY